MPKFFLWSLYLAVKFQNDYSKSYLSILMKISKISFNWNRKSILIRAMFYDDYFFCTEFGAA